MAAMELYENDAWHRRKENRLSGWAFNKDYQRHHFKSSYFMMTTQKQTY